MEAKIQVERAEFEAITRRLVARAQGGRGRVSRVPSADAEDVVQDAWEKAVKQKRVPEKDKLEAHVQEALVDTSRDYRRRGKRRGQVPRECMTPLDEEIAESVATEESEEVRIGIMRAREILEALQARKDKPVELFTILDALDYSEKEIAEHLGISEREAAAVRKRSARMRPALRKAIDHQPTSPKEEI